MAGGGGAVGVQGKVSEGPAGASRLTAVWFSAPVVALRLGIQLSDATDIENK